MNISPSEKVLPCPHCEALYRFTIRSPRDPYVRSWPARCDECRGVISLPPAIPEADAPPALRAIARPKRQYISRCYMRALLFVWAAVEAGYGDRLTVVHGQWGKFRSGHAWVEIDCEGGPLLFDGVHQRFYRVADTASEYFPQDRYTVKEAAQLQVRTGHYGPWQPGDRT